MESIQSRRLSLVTTLFFATTVLACGPGPDAAPDRADEAPGSAETGGEASPGGDAVARGERIIVSGASGQLGGLTVEKLLERGVEPSNLILVSRTPEELEAYERLGASTRFGDFTQPESLDTAYEGGDRILIISLNTQGNPNPLVAEERPRLHQTAIDAAVRAGVRHIVYTSFVDAGDNPSPIAVDHRLTEDMLRESGVAWTSLRNQWYGDRLVGEAVAMVEVGRAVADPGQEGTAFITREDCAEAAAAALTTDGHENRIYEITGSERVGARDVAAAAETITGVAIEIVEAGPGEPPDVPDLDSGTTLTDHFLQLTGSEPTTLQELLEANREALLEAGRSAPARGGAAA